MKVHRVKGVLRNLSGAFVFPVAERRRARILKDLDIDAPTDMPELVESDDDGMPNLADTNDDEDNNAEASAPSAEAEVRSIAEAHFGASCWS